MVARARPQSIADLAPGWLKAVLEFARRTDRIRVISERQDRDVGRQNQPGGARRIKEHRPVAATVGDVTGRDNGKRRRLRIGLCGGLRACGADDRERQSRRKGATAQH